MNEEREALRKSYIGSDDQAEFLYEDAKILIKHRRFDLITEDHEQAIHYKNNQILKSMGKL